MTNQFWSTQPVDRGESKGVIDKTKHASESKIPLPNGLRWEIVQDIDKITKFLDKFYVEDIDSIYRLSYSNAFLKFMFEYPHHKKEYSIGLFDNEKMVGYIMGREHMANLRNEKFRMLSVNFFCIDRNYRTLGLAPLMIKEITRTANINGIYQAVFTAEKDHGFSIARAEYYHYPLNLELLEDVELINPGFISPKLPILRNQSSLAKDSDLPNIYQLYLEKFKRRLHKNAKLKLQKNIAVV